MNIILVSKIHFNISAKEFVELATKVAQELNDRSMYNWKIWMLDREKKVGATIYYLENTEQVSIVEDYMNTMSLLYAPLLHKVEMEKYEVLEDATKLNFGPINFNTPETQISSID